MTVIGESQEAPEELFFVEYVRKSIEKLSLSKINKIYVRGKINNSKNFSWLQTINLPNDSTNLYQKPPEKGYIAKLKDFNSTKTFIQLRELINTIFLGGILAILIVNLWGQNQTKAIEWEYTIESFEDVTFDINMNRMGKEGWELVFARRALTGEEYSRRGVYECIFRRPKQNSNP